MRRTLVRFVCTLVCLAPAASALESTRLEVGTSLGVAVFFANGESITAFGLPGASSLLGLASLYVSTFPSPHLMIEPQLHVQVQAADGESASVVSAIVQAGYLALPMEKGSPYFAAHAGRFHISNGSSDGATTFGAALGYRVRMGPGGALRVEARVRKWLGDGDDLNEVALSLGLGGVFR